MQFRSTTELPYLNRVFERTRRVAFLLSHLSLVRDIFASVFDGYLGHSGWVDSLLRRVPIGGDGQPVPWMSLPAVSFLDQKLGSEDSVFEYGSGYSTLFFTARVAAVRSVESEEAWAATISRDLADHAAVLHREGEKNYVNEFDGAPYSLVVVDGRYRVQCMSRLCAIASPKSVIIVDDSDRPKYKGGIEALRSHGYREISFVGLSVSGTKTKVTSLFYKDGNLLGI